MTSPVERAAEALFIEIWDGWDAWELATESQKATTRQWVSVVMESLGLSGTNREGTRMVMDPIQVGITLAYSEIKSLCKGIVKHPDNDGERELAEHVLAVMNRYENEAREGDCTSHVAEVVHALGGLTEEWSIVFKSGTATSRAVYTERPKGWRDTNETVESRWVSPWVGLP